ncbi:MAG: hypothetical protein IPJ87_10355 [Flavobacteriales bacterium]|nr:hypothetical protein [Flavobacteriales bacterium]
MEQKKISLGLDLGVNTIGWALVERDEANGTGRIIDMGVRVIPMDKSSRDAFRQGKGLSQAQQRRMYRSARRNNQRYKMRRDKLVLVLDALGWMPDDIGYSITERKPGTPQVSILPLKRNEDYREREKGEAKREHTAMRVYELRANGRKRPYTNGKELGRVLYLLNQWRGYQDIGLLNEEEAKKEKELAKAHEHPIANLKILDTTATEEVFRSKGKKSKNDRYIWEVKVEGRTERFWTVMKCKWWKDKTMDFQTIAKEDGSIELRLSGQTKWAKTLDANEKELTDSGQLIGEKLYAVLSKQGQDRYAPRLEEKRYKRERYKQEFKAIWEYQATAPGWARWMNDCPADKLETIAKRLYPKNTIKQAELVKKGLLHIIRDEVIYYQRPLKKPQRQLFCPKETPVDLGDGKQRKHRPAPKSHPLYQEYRLWQQVNNMGVKSIGQQKVDMTEQHRVDLFEFLAKQKKAEPKDVLKKVFELDPERYELSMEDVDTDRTLTTLRPAAKQASTKADKALARVLANPYENNTDHALYCQLWHLLHTAETGKGKLKVLTGRNATLVRDKNAAADDLLSSDFIAALCKEHFEKGYAAYSQRALAKVVPLMRRGKYFRVEDIQPEVRERIEKIIAKKEDDTIEARTREKFKDLASVADFGGLMAPDALELVYGSHTPPEKERVWKTPADVKLLERGKLRQPVVEGVINEALLVARDLWKAQQDASKNPEWKFDEVVVEFARDLKNSAKERQKLHDRSKGNREKNDKAREQVRELLGREARLGEIERYNLWLDQGKKCIYSRETIHCKELFGPKYEIDHIVPKSRRFDDSYANKVLCLALLNKDKDNDLPLVWFGRHSQYNRSTLDQFKTDAEEIKDKGKRARLLAEKIEDGHIERQMKQTQYIVRGTVEQLGNLVGSANVRSTSGGITGHLRGEWDLDAILREANLWRFERLEKILHQRLGAPLKLIHEENGRKIISGWSKRIDHRNHSLDALVVACTRPQHIKWLNTLNRLRDDDPAEYQRLRTDLIERKKEKNRMKAPWDGFWKEAQEAFAGIITSIKVPGDPVVKKTAKYRVADHRPGKEGKQRWKSQPRHVAVLDELHLQPDGWIWRHVHKPAYDVLSLLKGLDPEAIRSQLLARMPAKAEREALLTLLEDNQWNVEQSRSALGKPKKGKAQKLDDVVYKERWVVARKPLMKLSKTDIRNNMIVDSAMRKQVHAWLERKDMTPEEAFDEENLREFNEHRSDQKLPWTLKVRVYDSLLDDNASRALLARKNSYNERLTVMKKKSYGVLLGEMGGQKKRTDTRINLFTAATSRVNGGTTVPLPPTEAGYFLRLKQMVAVLPPELSWNAFVQLDRRQQADWIYRFSNPQDQLQFQPHYFTDEMTVKADDHKAIAKNLSEGTMKVTGTEEEIKEYKKQLAKLKKPGIGEFYEGKEGHTRTLDSTQVDITKACIPLVVDRLGRIIGPSLLNGKA